MIQIVEERSGIEITLLKRVNKVKLMEFHKESGQRVFVLFIEVANQYRQEIEQLQYQLWQNNIDKLFQKSNGVPKKYLKKIRTMKMGKSKKQCSICCSEFVKDEDIIQLPCSHIFHLKCANSWLEHSTKCPNCRSDVLDALKSQEKQ